METYTMDNLEMVKDMVKENNSVLMEHIMKVLLKNIQNHD